MNRSMLVLLAAGSLAVASLVFVENAAAMPENVCEARCDALSPAQFPKEERWKRLPKYEQCMATCRKSSQ
jgi:hypothetical protein